MANLKSALLDVPFPRALALSQLCSPLATPWVSGELDFPQHRNLIRALFYIAPPRLGSYCIAAYCYSLQGSRHHDSKSLQACPRPVCTASCALCPEARKVGQATCPSLLSSIAGGAVRRPTGRRRKVVSQRLTGLGLQRCFNKNRLSCAGDGCWGWICDVGCVMWETCDVLAWLSWGGVLAFGVPPKHQCQGGPMELGTWWGYDPAEVEVTCQGGCWVLGP
jgi:hypothetical protein